MKKPDEDGFEEFRAETPVVFRMATSDFRQQVLEKLGRVEAKLDTIVGNGQPGRMKLAEDRISALERNDIKRSLLDRMVTAAIAFVVSAIIALHDHLGIR